MKYNKQFTHKKVFSFEETYQGTTGPRLAAADKI